MILDHINRPNDIKKISPHDYPQLAAEIRHFLVENVAVTGGHLASNLGAVELTMALHLVLDFPKDKIIWDVGHQSYTHKLLTGRKEKFSTLRQLGGMSGFPKREESDCDAFNTGHSSTSISAGIGLVRARDLTGQDYKVVSVIGDGALTGGMAYEALNNAAQIQSNFIIILNDNNMSISESTGGLSQYLSHIRLDKGYNTLKQDVKTRLHNFPPFGDQIVNTISRTKSGLKQILIPGMFFENLGITYLGPVDGHNISEMVETFREALRADRPILIHVRTQKGRGYTPALHRPDMFHGVGPFDVKTGLPLERKTAASYTDIFSVAICRLAQEDKKICAVTAAMEDGTGLKRFHNQFPDRFFDVGIAEEHAVTFAAGLAAGGMKPVVAVYSTFLQRAYDQIIHDVCLTNLPVVFAVDRAGLVGNDGATHQGMFDLSYLTSIPGMTVIAPKNGWELEEALKFALSLGKPCAVRFPRGTAYQGLHEKRTPFELGKSELITEGTDPVTLVALGNMVHTAVEAEHILKKNGVSCRVINARFAKPIDTEMMEQLAETEGLVVFLEENSIAGGFGETAARLLWERGAKCRPVFIGLPDSYVEHGSVSELYKKLGVDAGSVAERVLKELKSLNRD